VDLLAEGVLPPDTERKARAIPSNAHGWGQMKIDVACSGRLDLDRHNRERRDDLDLRITSHWIGTEEGMERAYRAAGAGLLPDPDDIAFYNAIPTAVDPSQAPAGQDTLYLDAVPVPSDPPGGWTDIKHETADAVMSSAAQFYGGLEGLKIARDVQVNEDIATRRRSTRGAHVHVDWVLNRSGPLRPALGLGGYRTPVEGLYLGGSGSHPGGGVTGVPGYLSAREVIRDAPGRRK
jgi:phytoene dehydrogenase-like protein